MIAAADYPSALLALNGTVVTNRRRIVADDFFTGLFSTALEEGEIITAVRFAPLKRGAYAKFPNPASRYAIVGVFVAETSSGVRVAVTGAGENGVFRRGAMEAALGRGFTPAAVEGLATLAAGLPSDIHGDAAYRAHLVGVMAKRAVAAAG
jgi:carbon-monoxide dehydrogenase medium subunit